MQLQYYTEVFYHYTTRSCISIQAFLRAHPIQGSYRLSRLTSHKTRVFGRSTLLLALIWDLFTVLLQ